MKRRTFISICGGLISSLLLVPEPWRSPAQASLVPKDFVGPLIPRSMRPLIAIRKQTSIPNPQARADSAVVDNIASQAGSQKKPQAKQIILSGERVKTFESVLARLARLQAYVGYGNFNVIGWDDSLRMAAAQSRIGGFSKLELDFIEELFFTDARSLGFYGDKIVTRLSDTIAKNDIRKIPGSGHYLFRGESRTIYEKIRKDLGESIVLTSGIRGVVKQIYLFLNKAARVGGNLSLASYSLAPPGHSYHAIGDFDVGKRNFGEKNFTEEFTTTDEFKRLSDLGYVDIRYPPSNPFGVRYEPWHIKVV